ncbi:helix-turn-helix transcriptional regulator [Hoeflea alexandrii]|uniref:helix-turn-helix domain-containing protein n=1 Tax=Hoeflea alexandrii TaxID=288436 RepID=UPI0035D06F36
MVSWLDLLKAEVAKANITQVADAIGYARTSVSLALNGKYSGSTDNLAAAVIRTYSDRVACPFLGVPLTRPDCDGYRSRAIPQSNAQALRHWRACRSCVHNLANPHDAGGQDDA